MSVTKVSRKGQITLHKNVRSELGIKPGDLLEEKVENHQIILRQSESPSVTLKGIGKKTKEKLKIRNAAEMIHEMRREDLKEL
jgi:AbrB family looped-hinge helix DNA binding protein